MKLLKSRFNKLIVLLFVPSLFSCSFETTKDEKAFVSRHYLLSFATKLVDNEVVFIDIKNDFKTGWSSPTFCDFHYDGSYKEEIVYKNTDLEKETNFGTYYLKGNTYYITNSKSETIIGYDMWPYAEVECPIAYNITMGFDHNVIIDGTRQTITFWYVGNVFMPYER